MKSVYRVFLAAMFLVVVVGLAGCHKKPKPLPPAPTAPPAAPAPTAQLTATPSSISAGDQVVLKWQTTDATSVNIEGVGDVPSSGVKTVTPTQSTSYHLVARGEGGSADATARVTVNAPPAYVPVPSSTMSAEEEFKANVQDVFFDYDSADIRGDAQNTLAHDAAYLNSHQNVKVVVGGYCDERGSNEYNLALGQNRAEAAKNALVNAGVNASRIRVISYGKEKPFCQEATEDCWQQNRRAGFTLDR